MERRRKGKGERVRVRSSSGLMKRNTGFVCQCGWQDLANG